MGDDRDDNCDDLLTFRQAVALTVCNLAATALICYWLCHTFAR